MARLISIGLAGLVGTLGRYWLSGWIARRFGETFPTGTLLVNVAGCFAAGFISYLLFERFLVSETTRTVLLIGLDRRNRGVSRLTNLAAHFIYRAPKVFRKILKLKRL